MRGRVGMGQVRSKKSKLIPAHPYGAGLKSRLIPAPPPLWDGENPHGIKQGEGVKLGGAKLPSLVPIWQVVAKTVDFFYVPIIFLFCYSGIYLSS